MNTATLGNVFTTGRAYETETLKIAATAELDRLLNLYRKAQDNFAANKGTIGEATAYEFGMKVCHQYEAAMRAYAALGLTDLGIHNVKAYAN